MLITTSTLLKDNDSPGGIQNHNRQFLVIKILIEQLLVDSLEGLPLQARKKCKVCWFKERLKYHTAAEHELDEKSNSSITALLI